jgi:dihydroorotate dehydrogenase (fumarate)
MGLTLRNPIVPSASPLARNLDTVRRLEDAGAAAITMYSLFEEQIRYEAEELDHFLDQGKYRYAESIDDYPEEAYDHFRTGPEEYLEQLRKLKEAVGVPVIASLNGSTMGGWTDYAQKIQQAGADALEINLYFVPTDPEMTGQAVEQLHVDVLKAVKSGVTIPVAMKLCSQLSSPANMARRLDKAGANALVLFNRFYQPVIDIENLDVRPSLVLSTPYELRLPLRWIAILHGGVRADLAATSGIHDAGDVVQAVMAGATVANVCSAVLKGGAAKIAELIQGLADWGDAHEYASVSEMRGVLSQKSCPDPQAFERANYMKTLQSYT